MIRVPVRGEIWLVDLDPVCGHEQAKKRPCVVISEYEFNAEPYRLAVVVPITSKYRKNSWHIELEQTESGLLKQSYIMCQHTKSVSQERFEDRCLGRVSERTLRLIEFRVCILMGIKSSTLHLLFGHGDVFE